MELLDVKKYWSIWLLMAASVLVVAANIAVGVVLYSLLRADEVSSSCGKEIETVARIVNATGQFPDGKRLGSNEKVNVKPDYCK